MKRISLTSEQEEWESHKQEWETGTVSEISSDTIVTKQLPVPQELRVSTLQPTFQEEDKDKNVNIKSVWEGLDTKAPPNRLLDSIPTSDLGESLDCRLSCSIKVSFKSVDFRKGFFLKVLTFESVDCRPRRVVEVEQGSRSAPVSANSLDSGDR